MTREEAYNRIDAIIAKHEIDDEYVTATNEKDYDALRLCRKVIEQEPCDNAISRQAVLDALDKRFDSVPMEQTTEILLLRKDLRELPLVNPEPKTGRWIRQTDDYHDYYECEYCGIAVGLDDIKNYCPNCGAEMVEPQESEGA